MVKGPVKRVGIEIDWELWQRLEIFCKSQNPGRSVVSVVSEAIIKYLDKYDK